MTELSSPHSPAWWRLAGIVAVYALIGPLAGALGTSLLLSLVATVMEAASGNASEIVKALVGGTVIGTIVFLPIAFSFGLISATGIGVAVAVGEWRGRGIAWRIALSTGLLFWVLMAVSTLLMMSSGRLLLPEWAGGLLLAHLLAVALCTALARRIFGTRQDADSRAVSTRHRPFGHSR